MLHFQSVTFTLTFRGGRGLPVSGGGKLLENWATGDTAHHRMHRSGAGNVMPQGRRAAPDTAPERPPNPKHWTPLDPERLLTDRRPAQNNTTSLYESVHTASTENKQQMKPYLVAGSSILESHSFLKTQMSRWVGLDYINMSARACLCVSHISDTYPSIQPWSKILDPLAKITHKKKNSFNCLTLNERLYFCCIFFYERSTG